MPDWEETTTANLLAAGKRSGYFAEMIADTKCDDTSILSSTKD